MKKAKPILGFLYILLFYALLIGINILAIYKFGNFCILKLSGFSTDIEQKTSTQVMRNARIVKRVVNDTAAMLAAVVTPDVFIPEIKDGLAPVIRRLDTNQNIVFLGIDDGAYKNPIVIETMKKYKIKASIFLADRFITDNRDFFKDLVPLGSKIENHTLHHKLLSQLTYEEQKEEICGMADLEERVYGQKPVLFRPPGGDYNTDTQRAAAACGMKAVVLWIAKANGGSMQYQGEKKLHKGDIVLMHFRPEFEQDMQAFVDAQNAAGLKTVLLDKWLR